MSGNPMRGITPFGRDPFGVANLMPSSFVAHFIFVYLPCLLRAQIR